MSSRGSFDRGVWREPLAFAADAVSLWDLNRLSPVNRSVTETSPEIATIDSGRASSP